MKNGAWESYRYRCDPSRFQKGKAPELCAPLDRSNLLPDCPFQVVVMFIRNARNVRFSAGKPLCCLETLKQSRAVSCRLVQSRVTY